jgi:hypothetical protein
MDKVPSRKALNYAGYSYWGFGYLNEVFAKYNNFQSFGFD